MEKRIHPDLKESFLAMPAEAPCTRENLEERRRSMERMGSAAAACGSEAVRMAERRIPGAKGDPDVRVKIYEPKARGKILPGLLFIHGGGFIGGSADSMDAKCRVMSEEIDCVIVNVEYRLAPEHPYPAAPEDCYAALEWFFGRAGELGVDPSRIGVYGGSAGGGLAIALTLLARDRKGPPIRFQMANYPMIDDRSVTAYCNEITDERVWNKAQTQFGWACYLGENPGEISPYAAPARAKDLSGLPPAYSCVGELDPFRDETIAYVSRLAQAGVPVEFHLYPGCFHGFQGIVPYAEVSKRSLREQFDVLKRALHG